MDKSRVKFLVDKIAETHLRMLQLEAMAEADLGNEDQLTGLYDTLNNLDIDQFCLLNELVDAYYDIPEQDSTHVI